MGRSSGGGSHSSGGFGGGRSSGGFSGGGRSSRSSSSRSHSSYSSRPRPTPTRNVFIGGPRFYGRPRPAYSPAYRRSSSVATTIIILIFVILSVYILFPRNSNSSIPQNTTQREALSGVVNKTDWYDDRLGWIESRNVLIDGLEDFYQKTGVQPYVVFLPYSNEYWNGPNLDTNAADQYLETLYDQKFSDEGHFIFAYFSCLNDDQFEMDGKFRYLSGYAADTIMDNEAISILWGHFEKNYYNTDLTTEKMISNTFRDTAKSIMSRPTNGWDFAKIAIIAVAAIAVVGAVVVIVKTKAKREKEKEEYTKEILDKPLETFGEDTSDLEEKYK